MRSPVGDVVRLVLLLNPSVISGLMHHDRSLSSFLLPVLVLLGSDGGVAVVHGGDGTPQEPHHTQALPVSGLGWAFSLLATSGLCLHRLLSNVRLVFPAGLPALVVAISVGFTKAKGYGTPS